MLSFTGRAAYGGERSCSQLMLYENARRKVLQDTQLILGVLRCQDYQNFGAGELVSSSVLFSPILSTMLFIKVQATVKRIALQKRRTRLVKSSLPIIES